MPYLLIFWLWLSVLPASAAENPLPLKAEETTSVSESQDAVANEELTNKQTAPATPAEEVYNVFTPQFMSALRQCKPAIETNQFAEDVKKTAQIIGLEDEKCHLQYADFDLYIPFNVLENIHSFDDLQVLLHNSEVARYNFQPQYVYNGLLHALNSCARGMDYLGVEHKEAQGNKLVKQGLEAEVSNDVCTIYLISELEIDGLRQDYTVSCRIDMATIFGLLNYYRELLAKFGERRFVAQGKMRVRSEVENEQTRRADAELMYFMQQKGLCE